MRAPIFSGSNPSYWGLDVMKCEVVHTVTEGPDEVRGRPREVRV